MRKGEYSVGMAAFFGKKSGKCVGWKSEKQRRVTASCSQGPIWEYLGSLVLDCGYGYAAGLALFFSKRNGGLPQSRSSCAGSIAPGQTSLVRVLSRVRQNWSGFAPHDWKSRDISGLPAIYGHVTIQGHTLQDPVRRMICLHILVRQQGPNEAARAGWKPSGVNNRSGRNDGSVPKLKRGEVVFGQWVVALPPGGRLRESASPLSPAFPGLQ